MITLEFTSAYTDQLDEWISHVPEQWKKVRGRINWGTGLEFKSLNRREMQDFLLVVTEWKFTLARGYPKTMITFLFNTIGNSCEVFIAAGDGQPQNDEKVAKAIEAAFQCLETRGWIDDF